MSSVHDHYENLLAANYGWAFGDFDSRVAENKARFEDMGITPKGAGIAIDLGCGSGFQTCALADLGFRVTAIDISPTLLAELARQEGNRTINIVTGDITDVAALAPPGAELITCMGDTLTHLESRGDVEAMLRGAADRLAPGGKLVLGFRDTSEALTGLDRIIPFAQTDGKIMTCVLEYEDETVQVHDLIHTLGPDGAWTLEKSMYRKLRLGPDWVAEKLMGFGFTIDAATATGGMVMMVASRSE